MKHLFRGLLLVAVILCCNFQQAFAQQMPPIPIDKNVRIGKLDNGLTYYIRKNNLPANRADFYIAQKVGSIQEEEINADWHTSWNTCVLMGQLTSPVMP